MLLQVHGFRKEIAMKNSAARLKVLNETFVPDERKIEIRKSLRRIEGQVKALERLIDSNRPCAEFLTQTAATQEALRRVGRLMLTNYLERCVTLAIKEGRNDEIYEEFTSLIYKLIK
ncbi:metal-sensitive transcriptional regulator [bacterium]|nr:metal-sensitive transcriptional regulator [bacterium]MCI0601557.1 metal-sensitive transcriptional regulator [bacterium]